MGDGILAAPTVGLQLHRIRIIQHYNRFHGSLVAALISVAPLFQQQGLEMDNYTDVRGEKRFDLTATQYKADLREAFMDGLVTAQSLSVAGVQEPIEKTFEDFYQNHIHRRRI